MHAFLAGVGAERVLQFLDQVESVPVEDRIGVLDAQES